METSPQIENGYTKIANEIMDALCRFHPGGAEGQILWAIIRKTYGWCKKSDQISISQLSGITLLSRRTVIYALNNLESKNMITIKREKVDYLNKVNTISFQKDYSKWVVQEIDGSARKCNGYKATIEKQKEKYKNRVVQEIDGSARNGKKVVQEIENSLPFLAPTKETITKETITKENTPISPLPEWLDKNLWREFLKMRTSIKKPVKSEIAITRLLNTLKKLIDSGYDQSEIIGTAIEKCWQSFYEPKNEIQTGNRIPQPTTYAQCQDAERRARSKWLLKQMEGKQNGEQNSDSNSVDESMRLLS